MKQIVLIILRMKLKCSKATNKLISLLEKHKCSKATNNTDFTFKES